VNTVKQETTSAVRPTVIEDVRWNLGCRISRIGDYLVKAGDRIHGDAPMGLAEVYELGHAMGKRKSGEAIDLGEIFSKAAKA
jgi:hypothetical protein